MEGQGRAARDERRASMATKALVIIGALCVVKGDWVEAIATLGLNRTPT